jgi:hypothetical protein
LRPQEFLRHYTLDDGDQDRLEPTEEKFYRNHHHDQTHQAHHDIDASVAQNFDDF